MIETREKSWEQFHEIDPTDIGPIKEIITPTIHIKFTNRTIYSMFVQRGDMKPTLEFGSKEPKHIRNDDSLINEIAETNSNDFCEVVAYVEACAGEVDIRDSGAKLSVSQDYERVVEAARIRAAQGAMNMDEADAIYSLYSQVVREAAVEFDIMRAELPA
ncbi:hypothetical protein KA047_03625 [Candidatus Saccharibacteria bacterium]|nr:hypothetical protein [Candidatus Saccharibacteria bacterium]